MLWQTSGGVNRENCIIYTGNISGNRTWNPHFCPGFSKKRIHGKKADSSGRHTDRSFDTGKLFVLEFLWSF